MSYLRSLILALAGTAVGLAPGRLPGQQAPSAAPPPLVLTRRQAVDSAMAHNPQLRVARE